VAQAISTTTTQFEGSETVWNKSGMLETKIMTWGLKILGSGLFLNSLIGLFKNQKSYCIRSLTIRWTFVTE
jgi:hypothetical protein